MTSSELAEIIKVMEDVDARGNNTIHRIETLKHKNFDPDPLAPWHRGQVRKDVANKMQRELEEETKNYNRIADQFPDSPTCDAICCKIPELIGA